MKIDLRLLPEEERKKWEPIVKPKKDSKSPALRKMAEEFIPEWERYIKDLKENKHNQEGAE